MKKIKKILLSVISVLLAAVIIFGGYLGFRIYIYAPNVQHSYNEIYTQDAVVLNADSNGIVRILKINDTHFFNGVCESDAQTMIDLKVILAKTPCDFIVVNGDLVDGFNLKSDYDKYQAIDLFAELIESYNVLWTFLPGNNDGEIDGDNDDIIAYMMQYDNFVCGNAEDIDGDMQFFVDVQYNGELVHSLAFMDTGMRVPRITGKYDYIKESQINWLLEEIDKRQVSTSVFFHMATPAFKAAFDNGEWYNGMPNQQIFPFDEIEKNELFDSMTADNEYISLISSGHIHANNLCSYYNGRYYQLSSPSGYSATRWEDATPSCTLTVIDLTQTDTQQMYSFEKIEA